MENKIKSIVITHNNITKVIVDKLYKLYYYRYNKF